MYVDERGSVGLLPLFEAGGGPPILTVEAMTMSWDICNASLFLSDFPSQTLSPLDTLCFCICAAHPYTYA